MSDFLRVLNDKQREAVAAPLGPVLVLAGAGSGKTRVLTYRIAYLLQKKLLEAEEILALTFTNKAAGEMKERIARLLVPELARPPASSLAGEVGRVEGHRGVNPSTRFARLRDNLTLTMGTFHSVCAKILRREIHKLNAGYSASFTIYDTEDALKTVKQIVLELGLSENFRPQVFAYYISMAKNKLLSPQDVSGEDNFFQESLRKVYALYTETLRASNALDFDDLLNITYLLFRDVPEVLKRYQKKFKYVLVDEYQDTNQVQYLLLKMLVAGHKNLFVVGDDAQSIYGFRGANMQNILHFKKDFPKSKIILLEQNYRSTQNILDAATKVIRLNPTQYDKKLWTKNSSGSKVSLYEAVDEMDEAEFALRRISKFESQITDEVEYVAENTPILNRYIRGGKFPRSLALNSRFATPANLNEYVVLYRTHAQSRPFEELMLRAGVPYQIVGGIKFYERREIKDVLAYMRLLLNPRDLVSLARVINSPARGIGPANLKQIIKALNKYDYNYQRLLLNLDAEELQTKALSGAKEFFDLLERGLKFQKKNSVLELMELMVQRSGYKDNLLDGSKEGEGRWENIEQLFNVAAKYKQYSWEDGLNSFLEEVALMTDLDSIEEQGNKLTLMTLHSAKGLEFDNVFFVGLEEGLLPHSRSMDSPQEIAEEIRLAYVGMTRAKRNLYLSYAQMRQTYGELKRAVPSRIIKAIPKRLLSKLN